MAFHSQAASVTVFPANGEYAAFSVCIRFHIFLQSGRHLTVAEVARECLTDPDTHFAQTKVISLENTLNGIIFPQEEILKIAKFAKEKNIKLHLDGARIWHAAAETGKPLKELCEPFDSISLCFSKGLGAPVGSCLTGSKAFIAKARAFRKLFGGGMRQTGYLAACAAFALTNHFPLLPSVHAMAKKLEKGLKEIGASITAPVDTCMVGF
jgi:threonine aldolase